MAQFSTMRNLDIWYSKLDVDSIIANFADQIDRRRMKLVKGVRDKAISRDNVQASGKLTHLVDGEPRFVSLPPLVVPISELFPEAGAEQMTAAVHEVMRSYRVSLSDDHRRLVEQFRLVDVARKVVGVGSVGTRAWVALLLGRDSSDPLMLQVKEAQASVLEPYVGRSRYASAGRRVVSGQRLMQASSDIFLGWHRGVMPDGVTRDFYLRQLKDGKGGFDPSLDGARAVSGSTGRSAPGPWLVGMPAPVTRWPSPPTWGRATPSIARSSRSRRPTPTRTSATTRHSWQPSPTDGSRRSKGSDAARSARAV